ncbi:MAG: CRISPR-associated endonuclease Cas6 [Bacteroidota bacterium]
MKTIQTVTISFPEIKLRVRDAHKLRGYFGNLFQEHSPLLHNHYENGKLRYAYPLVQYKVINQKPTLVGLGEGAHLLTQLFLEMKELHIEGRCYPVLEKNIEAKNYTIGLEENLQEYRFQTLWLALNQKNYGYYRQLDGTQRHKQLVSILLRNILSLYKELGLRLTPEERILASLRVKEKTTQFKNQKMLAFSGFFTTNALLPDKIGLGKAVSRGFGTVVQ